MKISSINALSKVGETQKIQNFKGLWGKETDNNPPPIPNGDDTYDIKIRHYYPFFDESEESIQKAVEENTEPEEHWSYCSDYPSWGGTWHKRTVSVEPKLPFKTQEWLSFVNKSPDLSRDSRRYIKQSLVRYGLEKYLEKK